MPPLKQPQIQLEEPAYRDGQTPAPVPELVRVFKRQSQMLCWPAGTQLLVLRGSVRLTESPLWQGETLLRSCTDLQAHSSHTLAREGWVLLLALEEAVVRVQRPATAAALAQPHVARGLLGLRTLWQHLRGWRGPRVAR
jgi:hypothetical protein